MTAKQETSTAAIPAAAAAVPAGAERITYPLPSGAKAQILKHPKGKHMRLAGRAGAQHPNDGAWQNYCLVAATTLVNGKEIVADDMDTMDLGDVNEMISALMRVTAGKSPTSEASSA